MASGERKPARARVVLTDISSRAWEHPADRGALVALRKLKGFDVLLKTMSGVFRERAWRLTLLGSAVRVDERQFARLHVLLAEVGRSLDVSDLPEMYVQADPTLGAVTVGMDRPIIVLSSGLVHHLDDDELRFVIGHELGHAVSGHAVYRTLLVRLLGLGGLLNAVPGGALGIRMVTVGLLEWSRKAELSADRAGLLASQDPTAALRTHMKLASGGTLEELDVTSFLQQGAEYDEGGDVRESLIKLSLLQQQSHPFAVVRATELRRWTDSGAYTTILAGDYPRRTDDDTASVSAAAQEAAASYTATFERTQDTLGRLVHDLAGWMGTASTWLNDRFRRGDQSA
ncbi:M48 family metallopeptidase [Nocardioides sp. zg-1228]|uniref:M48 family metallopeptidase n=1 Tax=Nocardioides sp. zg-1228 TaxID=2763008 RepID=UPI001642A3D1|nr:M48 family metallopeptidase [Nocardioides sp. zg-1228]MBC2931834.1 M48 family metallopeptidase [Nocardioides sp. zg-1228]QSF57403.1 M48 family metallopeptidase [Nocardioides sp. zg-1228]